MRIVKFFVENASDLGGVTLVRAPVEKMTLIPAHSDPADPKSQATILYTSDTHNAQSIRSVCYAPVEMLEDLLFNITPYEITLRKQLATTKGTTVDLVSIEFRLQELTDPRGRASIKRGMVFDYPKIIFPCDP